MGFFNVIKGAYPSLQQIDKTLPMTAGQAGIVRGSLIYEVSGAWTLGAANTACQGVASAFGGGSGANSAGAPGAYMYFCLTPQDDLVAGMAGTLGQGVAGGVPRLTGLACSMPMEIETDQFGGSPTVGTFLMCGANGKLVAHTNGLTAIAQVTKASTSRWVNNAIAVTGWRTGAPISVLRARTMYIPGLVVN